MKLTFWGAAQTTTGSFHLLETKGKRIALDCGLYQGRRSEYYQRNRDFPCPPEDVHAVLLSHAHIDHCGNLPNFVDQGFNGNVFGTNASMDLARTLLLDSAYIQEKDVHFVNKIRARKGEEPVEPLYTMQSVDPCLDLFVEIGYYRTFCFADGFCGRFIEAGHILGSAQVQLDIEREHGNTHRLVFSGDIGRGTSELLREPEIPTETQTLIMECTYGNRKTDPPEGLREKLRDVVKRTADRGGKVIIPAFSVGRTQEIVYQLSLLVRDKELPEIPMYVDSPLSANVTEIFRNHPECFNRETRDLLRTAHDPFGFERLRYTKDVEESKMLNDLDTPAIIISASGMCEAGRILHHLRNSVRDKRNTILIVGFQAEHTLGRRIVEKRPKVRIFGEEHPLRAEVAVLNGFSAHADQDELRDYAFRVHARSGGMLERVFLVHGESEGGEALAAYLRESLGVEVYYPERGETVEL